MQTDRETTHSEDCYRWHHKCAITRYEAALQDIKRLRKAESEGAGALWWLGSIRFAIGDNGKRMLPDLVEYIKGLALDAARYREVRGGYWPDGLDYPPGVPPETPEEWDEAADWLIARRGDPGAQPEAQTR